MICEKYSLVKEDGICYDLCYMEVALFPNNTLRIKGKRASLVVDPKKGGQKQSADAILLLQNKDFDPSRVSDYRVIVADPGEYEVGGIKMTGVTGDNGTLPAGRQVFYNLNVDNLDMILANTSSLSKFKELITEPKVAILNADSEIDLETITAIEPKVVVLYGQYSHSAVKALGKVGVSASKKFVQTSDKLPQESQVVWLA